MLIVRFQSFQIEKFPNSLFYKKRTNPEMAFVSKINRGVRNFNELKNLQKALSNLSIRFYAKNAKSSEKVSSKAGAKKKLPPIKSHTLLEHNCNLPFTVAEPPSIRLSSIICTIGPASKDAAKLEKMFEAGMRIARLNFSHGSYEYHAGTIKVVREAIANYSKKVGFHYPIAIALDTKGPEIRTGTINGDEKLTVDLQAGGTIKVTPDDQYKDKCSAELLYVDYKNITKIVKPDDKIYIDDGLISLLIKEVNDKEITCVVENGGKLGAKKGCNLPGIPVDLPAVSEKDKKDLRFGVEQCVDIIFASFIRDAKGIEEIKNVLGKDGEHIKIIAKIENQQGLDNIDSIIAACDGIMMARGDLGIEIEPERVFLAQKGIIARCNRVGKVGICATQMLESMTDRPRSTRAEAGDVANAIIDGADCVMLSGETAKGKYPIECVMTMAKICRYAEGSLWYERMFHDLVDAADSTSAVDDPELKGLAIAATCMSHSMRPAAILVIDCDGTMARYISRFRPNCPIIAVMNDDSQARQSVLHRGIFPFINDGSTSDLDSLVGKVTSAVKDKMGFKDCDKLLVLYETEFGNKGTTILKTRSLF